MLQIFILLAKIASRGEVVVNSLAPEMAQGPIHPVDGDVGAERDCLAMIHRAGNILNLMPQPCRAQSNLVALYGNKGK